MEKSASGIENYRPQYCSLGLTNYLFPDHDYPARFDYIEADFQYHYRGLDPAYATAFASLRYEPEEYAQAKAHCLRQFASTDTHQYQIGSFRFVEHICHKSRDADGNWIPMCRYPEHFNMFAYSDEANTLLFLGYYNSDSEASSHRLAATDFEAFYQEHFAQYYIIEQSLAFAHKQVLS